MSHLSHRPSRRHLSRLPRLTSLLVRTALVGAVGASALALAPAPAAVAAPAPAAPEGRPWPGHPDRALVTHVVRPGDTPSALAVRYRAWTRELIALNGSVLRVGQRVRVPVVLSVVRRAAAAAPTSRAPKAAPAAPARLAMHASRVPGRGWLHADLTRDEVRRLVARTARAQGVPPHLALAVAWQESGWQQRRVSSAGAIGIMQVMPDTGRWMRQYAGRDLRLRDSHDNVLAGVLTLKVLMDSTRLDNRAIAAYYQGLGAVRAHGPYPESRVYVRSVRALESSIRRTGSPV